MVVRAGLWAALGVFLITLVAGFMGSLIGAGGGFFIVPMLVLLLGVPIHEAVGISLSSVTATALSSFTVYAVKRLVDYKLGIILESFTVLGAVLGAVIALKLNEGALETAFGAILTYIAYRMIFHRSNLERKSAEKRVEGRKRWVTGIAGSFAAGIIVGLIGIGGGLLKVPIMVLILNVPMRIAIATSMFMISITAPTAAFTYFLHGLLTPTSILAGASGAALGAQIGSRVGLRINVKILRIFFSIVLLTFAAAMLLRGLSSGFA